MVTLAQHLQTSVIEVTCPKCKKPIQDGEPTGEHFIDLKEVCPDCYFEELGETIEKNPLGIFTRD